MKEMKKMKKEKKKGEKFGDFIKEIVNKRGVNA